MDWKTGQVRWAKSDGFGSGSFIVADDKLVVLSDKGELSVVQVSPDRYELLYRAQVLGGKCWTTPSLANGRLFLRNAAGDLVCLQVGELVPRS